MVAATSAIDTNLPNVKPSPGVLWLASWYPNHFDHYAGDFIQRAATALAAQLPVHLLYIARDEAGAITRDTKTEIRKVAGLTETLIYYYIAPTGISPLDKLRSTRRYMQLGKAYLKKFINELDGKPLIVEVAVAMRAGMLALWMRKKWGQPFVVQEHWVGYYRHLMPLDLRRSRLFWLLNNRILQKADWLLPDSRELGRQICADFTPIGYTEMPNTVNTSLFYPSALHQLPKHFEFVHVSTMGHQKNADGLLRVFERLLSTLPDRHLQLTMVGPNHTALQQQFKHLTQVRFTGPMPYQQVALQLQKAQAMVLFSRYENLPCVMLEAFCCGLPVIATNVGGIAHHLPAEKGILIPSEDEEALLQAMFEMVTGYEQYNRLIIAQSSTEQYGYQHIAQQYLLAYRRIYPSLF